MRTVSHLATTLFQLERVSEACDLRRQIYEVRNRILGPEDPATLSSLESLVAMLRWLGEPEESLATYQKLLDTSRGGDQGETSGQAKDDMGLRTTSRVAPTRDDLVDLLSGRPGWHLETSLTPGVPPIWCFRSGAKIEFSVAVDRNAIQLYDQETSAEMIFDDTDDLRAWLSANRPEALRAPATSPTWGARMRKFGEWE